MPWGDFRFGLAPLKTERAYLRTSVSHQQSNPTPLTIHAPGGA